MKMGIKWVALVVVVLAAVGGFFLLRGDGEESATATGPATEAVTRRTIEINAEASGVLEPIRTVEVKSKASGEVLEVKAQTGDRVEEGALLAEIDPRDVENALLQARADLEAARVKASTTGAHQKRLETLRESGVITQQEYESAYEAAAAARASLVRAETNLQLAKERRLDATIRAPIGGTIIERTVEPGVIIASATSNVSGGTTLFKMADLSAMQVRAKVDETDIGKVAAGQRVQVKVEAYPGRTFRGEVLKIEPQSVVEQNVTMFPVLVKLGNGEGLLRPGMNADVVIEVARRPDVLTVPVGALVTMREARSAARLFGVPEDQLTALMRRPAQDEATPANVVPVTSPSPSGREQGEGVIPERCVELEKAAKANPDDRRARRQLRRCVAGDEGASTGRSANGSETRPGVVFVKTPAAIEPRRVTIGLSDWDHAEIVDGVSEGDEVVLVSVAQLEQSQQRMNERIRERVGGGGPMGGGRVRGGGRR